MLHKIWFMRQCIWICFIALLFAGCSVDTSDNENISLFPGQDSELSVPMENRSGENAWQFCPSSVSDGYFMCAKTVSYYDVQSDEVVTLCAQTGCKHIDSTCQAWIGDVETYVEYHSDLYASISLSDNGYQLIRKNLSTGKITVIDEWENSKDAIYHVFINTISDHLMMVRVNSLESEMGGFFKNEKDTLWLYDLKKNKKTQVFKDESLLSLSVIGYSSQYAIAQYTPADQELMNELEFQNQYGDEYSYGRYRQRALYQELRLYDMKTQEYTIVATSKQDGFLPTGDPCRVYDKYFVYQCGNIMYLLDLDTGESRPVVTAENIVNYWTMDTKVFLITQNMDPLIASHPDRVVSIYYADFEDGELVKLENDGRTDVMAFGISQEGGTFFLGIYNDGTYLITKEDFYADRYENARKIG